MLTEDRVVGCLLGGALGDALGYPVEFVTSARKIRARFGEHAPERLGYAGPALISDDTQMTLFSAEGLLRARGTGGTRGNGSAARFALGAYQRWYATQEMTPPGQAPRPRAGQGLLLQEPRLYARRAPGNTCLSALAMSFTRPGIASVEDPPNGSKGCGAVMRAAAFGLLAQSREQAFGNASDAAVLTHGHPSGYLAAGYFAALIYDLARGASFEDALGGADALLAREPEHDEVASALAAARSDVDPLADLERLGGGWVAEEALAIGVACALRAKEGELAQMLWRAALHGGDSDSTASIAGNLAGARFGADALPSAWLGELELGDVLERVGRDLYRASRGEQLDPSDYPPIDGVVQVSFSAPARAPK